MSAGWFRPSCSWRWKWPGRPALVAENSCSPRPNTVCAYIASQISGLSFCSAICTHSRIPEENTHNPTLNMAKGLYYLYKMKTGDPTNRQVYYYFHILTTNRYIFISKIFCLNIIKINKIKSIIINYN